MGRVELFHGHGKASAALEQAFQPMQSQAVLHGVIVDFTQAQQGGRTRTGLAQGGHQRLRRVRGCGADTHRRKRAEPGERQSSIHSVKFRPASSAPGDIVSPNERLS